MVIVKQENVIIGEIVAELRAGKTLVYPTETCYGLGCDATNAAAVARLFAIKQRQQDKSMLLLMADTSTAREYVRWNDTLDRLAQRYWPGPLTVVAALKPGAVLPAGVVGQDQTLAFRITSHHLAKELCQRLGRPLVSTSANLSAQQSPYEIASVLAMFTDAAAQPDLVIDAGLLPHHSPSTIVRVCGEKIEVLRQGEIIVN